MGQVGILSVGAGDTKLIFNRDDPAEMIRAARIVRDMIHRGYALLVEVPPGSKTYQRAIDFIEDTCEYIIADFDPTAGRTSSAGETGAEVQEAAPAQARDQGAESARDTEKPPAKARGAKTKRAHAADHKVVAVAHTAGG